MSEAKVYQSGEKVPVTGTYEVAGAPPPEEASVKESPVRQLREGDVFPHYDGRECAWHLMKSSEKAQSSR